MQRKKQLYFLINSNMKFINWKKIIDIKTSLEFQIFEYKRKIITIEIEVLQNEIINDIINQIQL